MAYMVGPNNELCDALLARIVITKALGFLPESKWSL
jgi:hypothetical protein